MTAADPDDEMDEMDAGPRGLAPVGGVAADAAAAAAGALARLVEQSNREASANRAQARELVKALEGVQKSHEYLGTALRAERRRGRLLGALVVLAPLAAGAAVWLVMRRVDAMRADVDSRITRSDADRIEAISDAGAAAARTRTEELERDAAAARADVQSARDALDAERRHTAERETALAESDRRVDGARSEAAAREVELRGLRSRADAESARAAQLEREVERLRAELDAAAKARADAGRQPPSASSLPAAVSAPRAGEASKPDAAETGAAAATPTPAPHVDAAAAERMRTKMNELLAAAGGSVVYRVDAIGGFDATGFLDVAAVGADAEGRTIRSIDANRLELSLDETGGNVVLRFSDGTITIGPHKAPFFDGRYGVVVTADAAKWRASGLPIVPAK